MSNLESRTNIILFGPHNALSRCNISKQETSWGSENTMKIPYSTHIYRFFLIPILYNVLGHSVFCALWFFNVCTMNSIPKRCYCQMTDIQNKRKGISAGIVVFYERNKTNVCSGVFERRYNAALIYGSFKSHIMPALTIAIYCSCIIHFFLFKQFHDYLEEPESETTKSWFNLHFHDKIAAVWKCVHINFRFMMCIQSSLSGRHNIHYFTVAVRGGGQEHTGF